jgi:hypothetical protein
MASTARLAAQTSSLETEMPKFPPNFRRSALIVALAASTLLTACASESTYRPAVGNGFARSGYTDRQIEDDRFQVSFAGNSYTSRDTVEKYLLFRAAELTVQRGFDYFVFADRNVDKSTRTYATPGIGGFGGGYGGLGYGGFGRGFGYGGGFGGGYWGPSWRYRGRGFGWRSWDPFIGDPFFDRGIDINTIDKYEANAEIVVGKGPKPKDNIRAFDAREVLRNLGPSIVTPK